MRQLLATTFNFGSFADKPMKKKEQKAGKNAFHKDWDIKTELQVLKYLPACFNLQLMLVHSNIYVGLMDK